MQRSRNNHMIYCLQAMHSRSLELPAYTNDLLEQLHSIICFYHHSPEKMLEVSFCPPPPPHPTPHKSNVCALLSVTSCELCCQSAYVSPQRAKGDWNDLTHQLAAAVPLYMQYVLLRCQSRMTSVFHCIPYLLSSPGKVRQPLFACVRACIVTACSQWPSVLCRQSPA